MTPWRGNHIAWVMPPYHLQIGRDKSEHAQVELVWQEHSWETGRSRTYSLFCLFSNSLTLLKIKEHHQSFASYLLVFWNKCKIKFLKIDRHHVKTEFGATMISTSAKNALLFYTTYVTCRKDHQSHSSSLLLGFISSTFYVQLLRA